MIFRFTQQLGSLFAFVFLVWSFLFIFYLKNKSYAIFTLSSYSLCTCGPVYKLLLSWNVGIILAGKRGYFFRYIMRINDNKGREKRNLWIKGIWGITEIQSKDVLVMIEGKEPILVRCMRNDNIYQEIEYDNRCSEVI